MPFLAGPISSRSGSTSYNVASSPLDQMWDGTVSTFPSFVVSSRLRANEGKWNTSAPQGILKINGKDILTNYHSIIFFLLKRHVALVLTIVPYRIQEQCFIALNFPSKATSRILFLLNFKICLHTKTAFLSSNN